MQIFWFKFAISHVQYCIQRVQVEYEKLILTINNLEKGSFRNIKNLKISPFV